jgi:hypothetical protein
MKFRSAAFAAFALLAGGSCFATLGSAPSLPAGASMQPASGAARGSYLLPSGTVVTEYATAQGVVFAVTWSGPVTPDLKSLLGPYFDRYVQSQRGRAASPHTPLRIAAPDLKVVAGGHQGAMRGAAWLPALVPAGFDTGALL